MDPSFRKVYLIALSGIVLFSTLFANAGTSTLGVDGIKTINELLVKIRPAKNLVCLLRSKHQRSDQNFVSGKKVNDSLRLHLFSKGPWLGLQEMEFTFLVSDLMEVTEVAHPSHGVVEQITLYGQGANDSILTFQHDGRGRLVWAEGSDNVRMVTCHIKQRVSDDPFVR